MTRSWDQTTTDPVLEEAEVLALVRPHVRGARALTGVDESGRKARAYFVDDDIVLKTHRPQRLRGRMVEEFETSLEKEFFFLQQMAGAGTIAAPGPLAYGKAGNVEYICMTRVHGVGLRRLEASPEVRLAALRGLGETLARIHALPQAPFRESGLFPADEDSATLKGRLERLFGQIAIAVNSLPPEARLREDARVYAERALSLLPAAFVPTALHSNPAAEHVFVRTPVGEFAGLIDFADAYISHPAFDLRPYRHRGDREAVLKGYAGVSAVDAGFISAAKAAMVLGELANVTRRRQPPHQSQALIEEIFAW